MMYTKEMILGLVEEMRAEEKKTERIYPYYKYRGEMRKRSYPDLVYTDRYKELFFSEESPLRSAKIFKSSVSGEMLAYLDLEAWCCDFEKDYYISGIEYEEEMGEDL